MKSGNSLGILTILVLLAGPLGASTDSPLSWDDLIPEEARVEDPFARLNKNQMFLMSMVANVYDRLERGDDLADKTLEQYKARREKLEGEGIDVEHLLAVRGQVVDDRERNSRLTNRALDDTEVRIPGYLLPLEYDGTKVTEFLLVPYVGACIHTPPPPPNQIVHVTANEGYRARGLFIPVWVSGRMQVKTLSAELSLVDGSAPIESAYSLEGAQVEPYKR